MLLHVESQRPQMRFEAKIFALLTPHFCNFFLGGGVEGHNNI